jgi:hypothetical protein
MPTAWPSGPWVAPPDEIPNHQVRERDPIRRSIPGLIEQQEFEHTRHGTVNTELSFTAAGWKRCTETKMRHITSAEVEIPVVITSGECT